MGGRVWAAVDKSEREMQSSVRKSNTSKDFLTLIAPLRGPERFNCSNWAVLAIVAQKRGVVIETYQSTELR